MNRVPGSVRAFDAETEAAKARDREAARLFGEFAYLNFPKTRR